MKKQTWFALTVRSIAALLLFVAAGVLLSILNPVSSPVQQAAFMMGMMDAMHRSMMGSMMSVAVEDGWLNFFLLFLSLMVLAVLPVSIGIGLQLRKRCAANEKE